MMTTKTTQNGAIGLAIDDAKIATLTLQHASGANKVDGAFGAALNEAVTWLGQQKNLSGVIIASAHKDWSVGADLEMLYKARDAAAFFENVRQLQQVYRALETCGAPVAAALTGSALGGGFELALSCHYRVALADGRIKLGLPEVLLGVIPGAGGTQRLPRLLGFQAAADIILQGKSLRPDKAKAAGLVHELKDSAEAVIAACREWIKANPKATQPWDAKGFKFPAPRPGSEQARDMLLVGAAMLHKKTAGAYRAPEAAIRAVAEGAHLDFDRALEVEARHFVKLVVGDQSKDMMRALWFHKNAADKQQDLPKTDTADFTKIGMLGAGMMGAAIAWSCAERGYQVVLKDIKQESLDAGYAHCKALTETRCKHLDQAQRDQILARITPTLELGKLEGCDLIIEAVFEDPELKRRVIEETQGLLAANGVWASNTSALPISDQAKAAKDPQRFIGLHFFSPVEKMPLLEIIAGEKTDD